MELLRQIIYIILYINTAFLLLVKLAIHFSPYTFQPIIVVKAKVVIQTKPVLTGSFYLDEVSAIGALPKPASLEKIPFDIPSRIAEIIPTPAAAPIPALKLKASLKIVTRALGTSSILNIITPMHARKKVIAITETKITDTLEILSIPPITAIAEGIVIIIMLLPQHRQFYQYLVLSH